MQEPSGKGVGANPSRPDPDIFQVRFRAPDPASLANAIRDLGLDIDHQHPTREEAEALEITGFLTEQQIETLKKRGWDVSVGRNLSEIGRERQKDVGRGDRFEGGKVKPTGLGKQVREERK